MIRCGCWDVGLINSKSLGAQVCDNIALNLFICNNDMVSISKRLIFVGICPGNLLGLLRYSGESLVEIKSLICLSLGIVDSPKEK